MVQQNISAGAKIHRRHFQFRPTVAVIGYGKDAVAVQIPQGSITVDLGTHLVIAGKGAVVIAINFRSVQADLYTIYRTFCGDGAAGRNRQIQRHRTVLTKRDFLPRGYRHRAARFQTVPAGVQLRQGIHGGTASDTKQPDNRKNAGENHRKHA